MGASPLVVRALTIVFDLRRTRAQVEPDEESVVILRVLACKCRRDKQCRR